MKKYKIKHWLRDTLLSLIGIIVAIPIIIIQTILDKIHDLIEWVRGRKTTTVNDPATDEDYDPLMIKKSMNQKNK